MYENFVFYISLAVTWRPLFSHIGTYYACSTVSFQTIAKERDITLHIPHSNHTKLNIADGMPIPLVVSAKENYGPATLELQSDDCSKRSLGM